MKRIKTITLTLFITSILFVSCKKDTTAPANTSPVPSAPTPSFGGDVKGALVSLRTSFSYDPNKFASLPITVPVVDLEAESGVAVFSNDLSTGNYLDAGAVSVNTNNLPKLSNNSYTKLAFDFVNSSFSLDFDGGSQWSVEGKGDVPAISYNHTQTFPNYTGRASMPETASTTSNLTVSLSGISNADSVYVLLVANNKEVLKRVGSSTSSVTFTAAEIQSVGTTGGNATAYLEVCPFRYTIQTISTKQYAFIKEYAVVKNVTIN